MKNFFGAISGLLCAVLGAAASVFGGWSAALTTLLVFMLVDYASGLIVAGVFHVSPKSENGALESRAGWKGLCRKGVTLLIVLVASRVDLALGTAFVRDAVIVGYISNEVISIIENAGLMGVPIPDALVQAIDALQGKDRYGD